MNTADYIVKKLEELGVNEIFGLPGDYNFNILKSIEKNPNVKWIGCTNELNAGYAADGYARLSGFGAIVTTYGVGELSAINAIAGCYAENIPVIQIVGVPSTKDIENKTLLHHNLQEVDYKVYQRAYDNFTAASAYLTRDNAKLEIDRVLRILLKERKPVYIAIPSDIAKMEISDRSTDMSWLSDIGTLKELIQKIADKINDSSRPVILGDALISRFDSKIEYREFVSKSGIPVTNFLMGTNIIDNDYELYLGGYFGKFANSEAKKYVDETDCLISVGVIYSDINAYGFDIPFKINDHIAIYGTYTYVDGKRYDNVKMSDVLESLTKIIEPKNIRISKPQLGYERAFAYNAPVLSKYIYPRLQEFIKENDIVFAETGIVAHGMAQSKFPNNVDVQLQTLYGSIGWATPAILGACLAKPKSRVLLITGEGSHQLTAMEIGNMLRYGVKPIIIVINNGGYTTERFLSDNKMAEYHDIVGLNYAKFARVFDGDIWATRVETEEDFDKALKVTQIMNKMCYIEVCTDKFDAPSLIVEVINSFKDKEEPAPVTIHEQEEKLSLSAESFEYETTVHRAIKENIESVKTEEGNV